MQNVGIIGNGPTELIPDLDNYKDKMDIWIGADRGAITIIDNDLPLNYALGDFDSISNEEKSLIQQQAHFFEEFPIEKDHTDLEIAIFKAYELNPVSIYLFGVTGGRLDHSLINIQLLYAIIKNNIQGTIVDKYNQLTLTLPGTHTVVRSEEYPNISFIAYTPDVYGLTLEGFYYPLEHETVSWGSTLCISNKLLSNNGTFSYQEGILLLVKSRDAISDAIPK
ncbi:thiamine diphosphokinase [Virgibacillus byunsanensis]|uniref:Thiamine diphosphokinase n=1 Tax=Virgibacillus byunsanensis TaxID=570945 RepID=A0ABW3LK61_9BACI